MFQYYCERRFRLKNFLRGFTDPGTNLGKITELKTPKDDAWHHAVQSTGFLTLSFKLHGFFPSTLSISGSQTAWISL